MHRTVIIFMIWGVGGREAAGVRIIRNAWAVIIFMVLEVGKRGGRWLQNHRKCIGQLSFSWF